MQLPKPTPTPPPQPNPHSLCSCPLLCSNGGQGRRSRDRTPRGLEPKAQAAAPWLACSGWRQSRSRLAQKAWSQPPPLGALPQRLAFAPCPLIGVGRGRAGRVSSCQQLGIELGASLGRLAQPLGSGTTCRRLASETAYGCLVCCSRHGTACCTSVVAGPEHAGPNEQNMQGYFRRTNAVDRSRPLAWNWCARADLFKNGKNAGAE